MTDTLAMATSWETGSLGAFHLKRLWSAAMLARRGCAAERPDEEMLDKLVLNALGVGLHQAYEYLYQSAPSFADFEDWIVATAGRPDPAQIERLNADIARKPQPSRTREALAEIDRHLQVLTDFELAFWRDQGYVVLRGAVDAGASAAAARISARPRIVQYINMVPGLRSSAPAP